MPQLAFEELRSLTELSALAPRWNALWERCPEATVFQRSEWLLAYVRHLFSSELRVLTLWHSGELVGAAPFFRWERDGRGVLSLLGAGVSDYQDVLAAPELRQEIRQALAAWLSNTRAEHPCWEWSELAEGSLLRDLEVERQAESWFETQEACPGRELPGSWGELSASLGKNLRYDIAHALRRLARMPARFESASDERSFERLFTGLAEVHRARREALGEETAFARPEQLAFQRAAAMALFQAGMARLHGLFLDGQLGGAIYVFRDRDAVRLYQCGFDPSARPHSPGSLLIAHALQHAIAEGSRLADFLRGEERYKYRWGARDQVRLARRRVRLAP